MSSVDIFYLSLVLVAFSGFAAALAYFSQRDRLTKRPPAETSPQQAPVPAKESAARAGKVHEHA
jgi:hypothetical protein